MNTRIQGLYLLAGLVLSSAAVAERPRWVNNGMYPNIGMDWDSAIQNDYSNASAGSSTNDIYADINPIIHFRFSPNSEIWLDTELSPVNPPNPGERRYFEDLGLMVNDLNYYQYNTRYWFRVGKYEIPFGRAWDIAPGLYTADFVGDYDFDGQIGGVFAYRINAGKFGVIQPIIGTHFQDTSFLSRAYLQNDQRLRKSDGGPANTESFESYSLVVNWNAIPSVPNLETQIGHISNHRGQGDQSSESAYTVSARYYLALDNSNELAPTLRSGYFDIVPFVEYVKFDNKDGVAGAKMSYLTTSVTVDYGQWNVGLTRTDTDMSGPGSGGPDDYLNELSVQYNFTNLFTVQVGVGTTRMSGQKFDLIGINFDYARPY